MARSEQGLESEPLPTREFNLRRRALLELAVQAGLANPTERPDQYLLLVLWTPEESAGGLEPLTELLAALDSPLGPWISERLRAQAFIEAWRRHFGEVPSVEAFWLYLAKPAICRFAAGCLKELCAEDPLVFARALAEKAPLGGWLSLRRKKRAPADLDPCQETVLLALRHAWKDELSRKLEEDLPKELDEALAGMAPTLAEPFPQFLGLPPWGLVAIDYLERVAQQVETCPPGEERLFALLPGLPQLFDEVTAPRLAKRRGCQSARPGTPLFAAGASNRWPKLAEALSLRYATWSRAHPGRDEEKRFFAPFGTLWGLSFEMLDVYHRALEAVGEERR